MKYKPMDRVRIKSLDWYNENKNKVGRVWTSGRQIPFEKHMSKWCGKVMTISDVRADHYTMIEDLVGYWTDEMIEGLVEDKIKPEPKFKIGSKVILAPYSCIVADFQWNDDCGFVYMVRGDDFSKIVKETDLVFNGLEEETKPKYEDEVELIGYSSPRQFICPIGYEFKDENGNVINAHKIVLEKKKKEYPKTYEECCKVMNYCCNPVAVKTTHREELIMKFQFLLLYRDAYWKIAGEEMGLGKSWEPDWCSQTTKYTLRNNANKIIKEKRTHDSYVLAFPTEEMRDAFYENFKEEIEFCKELL